MVAGADDCKGGRIGKEEKRMDYRSTEYIVDVVVTCVENPPKFIASHDPIRTSLQLRK